MENKKVINWSLVVLFLSLSIVYVLTYQKKESLFKSSIISWNQITSQMWVQNQNLWLATQSSVNVTGNSENIKKIEKSDSNEEIKLVTSSETRAPSTEEEPIIVHVVSTNTERLPGTTEYFGTLDIVSILEQDPEFTLQDSKWNYFVYYGNHLDFIQTVETLGGNVYEMKTESEILQNHLFGDRVSYINLSMFKDIWVIMVIRIDGDVRLLQIPADKYHYSKDYLKSLFIH